MRRERIYTVRAPTGVLCKELCILLQCTKREFEMRTMKPVTLSNLEGLLRKTAPTLGHAGRGIAPARKP